MNIEQLFNPRSVAVIGASQNLAAINGQPIAHLKAKGYAGQIYPVNPRYQEVAGYRCYPDIDSLPEAPDVAVIAVAAKRVPEAVRALGERGTPFAVILSSGFAEAGEEGRAAQREVTEIARRYGMQILGPNCQGYMNIADAIHVGFGAPYAMSFPKGGVSLTSQSGAFGNSILMLASEEGLGFRRYLSTGNESVTTTLDIFEALIDDPETRVIAGYVEGFQDAHRLVEIGTRALRAGKPIVVWKVGTSEAGAKAAASHTANLGGAMALYRAAFKQVGIVEANDVGDLADCAKALLPGRIPKGNRMAVVTISGGAGIAMADRAAEADLTLPELAPQTVAALKEALPDFAAVANPLDVTAALLTDAQLLKATLERLADDPNVDMIALALAAASGAQAAELAREVVRISEQRQIPILVAWNADECANAEAYRILDDAQIPRYGSPVRCARGAGALWEYAKAKQRLSQDADEQPLRLHRPAAQEVLAGRQHDLTEFDSKRLLAQYEIPVTREWLATTREEAEQLAAEIGLPVAMKIQSSQIPHKTEAGGVRIGVADAEAVGVVFDEIMCNAARYAPEAVLDGVLVQEMLAGGTELIVGAINDPLFGPAVMVGFGGVFAEVTRDVSFRLAPVTPAEAQRMIRELKGFAILDGARGRPKADVAALADLLVRVSAMAMDCVTEFAELDLNPVFVRSVGEGVRAADALIKPKPRP
ncbi:acetate--CoA ligase family protein [Halomonas ramblicola]|uniref:acetate--CoA ligase family protein n=1 Tax=Halomonas ramblicola TaxID=747349 RepID=UPI0025B33E60|nr:acetate--CoA ligase family protein [Halomonas ramblicola]MDN3522001.1 acetate--CoA ligase family protein [Halomonas ramblicola]